MRPRSYQELERAVRAYIAGVLDGSVVAGRLVRLAVERHERDLVEGPNRGLRFNDSRALKACYWIEHRARFSKGEWAGKPFILEGFELFIVWCLFGWESSVDGRWIRRFRHGYVSMARKNAKTELAAVIGLLMAAASGMAAVDEIGAEVYSAATKKDQAAICWKAGARIVQKSPELRKEFRVFESRYHLVHDETESTFQALAADADTLDGLGPYCAIVDELHAHPNSTVWDVLDSGTGARRESLLLAITTSGSRREGVCWDLEQDAVKALEGVGEGEGVSDDLFAFIARLDEEDDPFDEAAWPKSNPNLGVSVHLDQLRIAAATAKRRPSALNEFLRKRMNLWTEGETAWITLDRWDECAGAVDLDALRGKPCYAAFDLSSTTDMTACVVAWPLPDGHVAVKCWAWIPEETIADRGPRERALFMAWLKAGLLEATPGETIDYDPVWERIVEIHERYDLREAIFDRWQASALIGRCEQLGIERVGFGQGYKSMNPAMQVVESLVSARRLVHDGDPVLRWAMSNVSVKTDPAGNRKPDKARSADRIDPAVALCMATDRAVASVEQSSVYETKPLGVLG